MNVSQPTPPRSRCFLHYKLNYFEDNFQLVKVGVSSFHLGEQRIKSFRKKDMILKMIQFTSTPKQLSILRGLLNLGKEASFEFKFDGYTEHRLFNQNDFVELKEYLVGRGAVSVLVLHPKDTSV